MEEDAAALRYSLSRLGWSFRYIFSAQLKEFVQYAQLDTLLTNTCNQIVVDKIENILYI